MRFSEMGGIMAKEPQPEKTYEEKMLELAKQQVKNLVAIKETLWFIFFALVAAGIVSVVRWLF